MRINLINPNTNTGMTEKIRVSATQIALPTTTIECCQPEHGPWTIESVFDETIAASALLDCIQTGEERQVDAHIIACFGDPGLAAACEIASVPVIGIAQAAFHIASLISARFGIVTTKRRTIPIAQHLIERYGFTNQCTGIRARDIAVSAFEHPNPATLADFLDDCRDAIHIDGAEALVLGCAGMTDLVRLVSETFQVPVIDGVAAAVKLAESLYQLELPIAKQGLYQQPFAKPFAGRYRHWSK